MNLNDDVLVVVLHLPDEVLSAAGSGIGGGIEDAILEAYGKVGFVEAVVRVQSGERLLVLDPDGVVSYEWEHPVLLGDSRPAGGRGGQYA